MDDAELLTRIQALVDEEHRLEREDAGEDPDAAQARPAGTVEGYQQ